MRQPALPVSRDRWRAGPPAPNDASFVEVLTEQAKTEADAGIPVYSPADPAVHVADEGLRNNLQLISRCQGNEER
jgi:hypothetical protein